MFDYSDRIEAFRQEKVRLLKKLLDKLYEHRRANRKRLISRLPNEIDGLSISQNSFNPQGSTAVDTVIQTKFKNEEYDIDDGLVLPRGKLINDEGKELTSNEVRRLVLKTLKDSRFVKQPKFTKNAIRVFYKEEDEERHHIDIPVYRYFWDENENLIRELATEEGWMESDPTQVNVWFLERVKSLNKRCEGKGTQFRKLIQLLKRFCRSRDNWDMPNGMKLTMLVAECQPTFSSRVDIAFKNLLENLKQRLADDKIIKNLAHPDKPDLTRTGADSNIEELELKIEEALGKLKVLGDPENDNEKAARNAWDWIFRSDGYFSDFDKKMRLEKKAELIEKNLAMIHLCLFYPKIYLAWLGYPDGLKGIFLHWF